MIRAPRRQPSEVDQKGKASQHVERTPRSKAGCGRDVIAEALKGVFTALAFLAFAGNAQAQGRWETTASGCKVWNDHPRPDTTVTWSGGCVDGEASGQGVLVRSFVVGGHRLETRYRGSMRDGDMAYYGRLTLANGDVYDGRFRDGLMHGEGVYSWANGDRYDGEFRKGRRHGKGVYKWANGNRYEGSFSDGLMNGVGEFVWANGDRYNGAFRDGKPDGKGIYTWASGRRLEGEFRDGWPVHGDGADGREPAPSAD